jgi:MoaA/NifB/PqqE/SkfB family radical SAM enzyme
MKKPDFSKLYSALLRGHSALPRLLGSPRALPLLNVSIEVTHRCNLRCAMCFQRKRTDGAGELTEAELLRLVDGLPPWTIVTFTGGEPFMRPDFRAVLRHALTRRRCNILTNAELVTDQDIASFVDGGLALIGVSIDGLGDTHDGIRRKRGLFAKAAEVLRKIAERKKLKRTMFPLIDVKTVILKENLGELEGIHAFANGLGADFFSLSLQKLSDRQFNEPYYSDLEKDIFACPPNPPPALTAAELETLLGQLDAMDRAGGPVKTRFYPYNMLGAGAVKKYYADDIAPGDFAPCGVPWSLACVSPYGDVFPCLSYKAGNVREEPLAKIWNGERMRAFRARLGKQQLDRCCLGCCYSIYKAAR